jgi:hypothetical protein
MLNVDIALVRDFSESIGPGGEVTCGFNVNNQNACPFASTILQAAEYQEDNQAWLGDFRDAFIKMSQNGYEVSDDGIMTPEDEDDTTITLPPGACFSGENTVALEGGETIPIRSLNIGDKVLVQDGSYDSVYSFGHRNPTASSDYLRLATKSAALELSPDHMVLVRDRLVPASTVQLGDFLSNGESVTSIKSVNRKGVYAPFTTTGTIVVSGIVSSSFISLQKDATNVMLGSSITLPVSWQWMCHTFEMPHRFLASYLLGKETYTKEGICMWVAAPKLVMGWVLHQHVVVTSMILIPSIMGLGFLALIAQPWFVVAVTLLSLFATRRVQKAE